MELIYQPTRTACGAACYAMIRGCDISGGTALLGVDWTTPSEMLAALNVEGEMDDGHPPHDSVAIQYHQQPIEKAGPAGPGGHWTVWNRGELLDPASIGKRIWPVKWHKVIEQKTR